MLFSLRRLGARCCRLCQVHGAPPFQPGTGMDVSGAAPGCKAGRRPRIPDRATPGQCNSKVTLVLDAPPHLLQAPTFRLATPPRPPVPLSTAADDSPRGHGRRGHGPLKPQLSRLTALAGGAAPSRAPRGWAAFRLISGGAAANEGAAGEAHDRFMFPGSEAFRHPGRGARAVLDRGAVRAAAGEAARDWGLESLDCFVDGADHSRARERGGRVRRGRPTRLGYKAMGFVRRSRSVSHHQPHHNSSHSSSPCAFSSPRTPVF